MWHSVKVDVRQMILCHIVGACQHLLHGSSTPEKKYGMVTEPRAGAASTAGTICLPSGVRLPRYLAYQHRNNNADTADTDNRQYMKRLGQGRLRRPFIARYRGRRCDRNIYPIGNAESDTV